MKIATWNIERLKHKSKLIEIITILNNLNAAILVLTETDSRINLSNFKYKINTPFLTEIAPDKYKTTENRISIFTNYEIIEQIETYDKYTSLCLKLKTEIGDLLVYGTIIGIYGNRHENFKMELLNQLEDYKKLSHENNLCIIGDYNISFSDNYYFTNFGREELNKSFETNNLELVTRERKECIDHIAISQKLIKNKIIETKEWNENKKLSDHKGICIIIN